jgi:hypothetical protein
MCALIRLAVAVDREAPVVFRKVNPADSIFNTFFNLPQCRVDNESSDIVEARVSTVGGQHGLIMRDPSSSLMLVGSKMLARAISWEIRLLQVSDCILLSEISTSQIYS